MTNHAPPPPPAEFSIGIAEIDLQHRGLNTLLERLRTATENHYNYAASVILAELAIQTRIHFAVEESLMRLLAFPGIEPHLEEHRRLTEQLVRFRQRAEDFDVSDRLSEFIQTWLIDHINNFDRLFVAHFLRMGVDPAAAPKDD